VDKIAFYPYFYVKDLVGWVAFAIFFLKISIFVFYALAFSFLFFSFLPPSTEKILKYNSPFQ
jgi:hypothetical protein